MPVERLTVQPRTPQWFELRRQDLTMSEIGAVLGLDRFKSGYDVWAAKAGLAAPLADNEAMKLGRWGEPAVALALAETMPDLAVDYPLNLYVRDPAERMGGTPDGTARHHNRPDELIVLEFKLVSRQSFERYWEAGVPLSYQLQTLGNAMLLDAHHGLLAALVMGYQDAELVVHEIPRNAGAEAGIRAAARKFWMAFDAGHAPQPDYARDGATLKAMFPPRPEVPAPIDLSADNMMPTLLERRETLKTTIRGAEKECETIDAEIVHKLAGAERATLPGWKITRTMTHREARMVPASDYPTMRIARTKEISL